MRAPRWFALAIPESSVTAVPSSVPAAIFPHTQCLDTAVAPRFCGPASKVQPLGGEATPDGDSEVPSHIAWAIRISPAVTVAGQSGERAVPLVCVDTPAP
ncbi:MAG: hypothetical protein A3H02_02390 [Candidatus Niyogibacteria bacterium RIFCSPLOWO2_12_FULL_41_13]|uniref:Uncharacterized protein n=1 Tax=Candidatus Niyogibacteria bacterium RIFCSPLOWO2_12_FULL_41_13 TaxID=1801726 RepID=A0A1G2F0G3_9BACT|nr:MAG: hypothetical protein A3H02_02390 [Candidatus Niyogibacteria bacterium RIFCSPLOWO2_12_FULL_41_13]